MPGRLGKSDFKNGGLDGLSAAFVLKGYGGVSQRKLLRAQPATKLHDEPSCGEKHGFGVFDTVRQFSSGAEGWRNLEPLMELGRETIGTVERIKQIHTAPLL
ncbi:hypothetical protein AWB81_07777 [Caballeronia arationis]|jgi:hypothetical protein|nr:hypothetical protein AWB81_07777 [Caballeronia arationis]